MKLHKYQEIEKNIEYWQNLFISNKKVQTNSKHTISTYNRVLEEFKEFCYLERVNGYNELSFKDMNKYFINGFINYLKDKKLSDKTISLYLTTIKMFFKFISEENSEAEDILTPIEKVFIKVAQKEAPSYTDEEIKKIDNYLRGIINKTKSYKKVRNALAILFLIYTGLRASELLSLKKENVDIGDDGIFNIKVKGKGDKERIIYIKLDILVEEWDKFVSFIEFQENKLLFNIKYITLYEYNQRLCKKLHIENKGLHAYRHHLAIKAVDEDINLQTISEWLGHSSIVITSKYYAKASKKAKKRMADKIY